jgi:hypothetical protein
LWRKRLTRDRESAFCKSVSPQRAKSAQVNVGVDNYPHRSISKMRRHRKVSAQGKATIRTRPGSNKSAPEHPLNKAKFSGQQALR